MSIKPWQQLTFTDDYMFKLVLLKKDICIRILERILAINIRDIQYLDDEKSLKFRYDSKGIRLDVYTEADGTIYEIEMQVKQLRTEELAKRTRYYQSMIDLDMLKAGCKYKTLKPIFIIFLCTFDPYGQGRHMYTFRNLCVEDSALEMQDAATKIFLNSKGTMNDVTPEVKSFLDYLNGILSQDDLVKKIETEIQEVKKDREKEVSYMTYEMKLDEMREEGHKEGRKEGRREGENKLARLMSLLLSAGKDQEIRDMLTNEDLREQLYLQYNIQ